MAYFLHSVEFYVIMTVVAAAVIALCVRPSQRAAAQTHTVGGWLCEGPEAVAQPMLHIECLENGDVLLRRTGVVNVGATGALSLAILQMGFDLEVGERLTPGASAAGVPDPTEAVFILKFLAPEWYHVRYTTDPGDRFAAFALHVRPGLKMTVPLRQ